MRSFRPPSPTAKKDRRNSRRAVGFCCRRCRAQRSPDGAMLPANRDRFQFHGFAKPNDDADRLSPEHRIARTCLGRGVIRDDAINLCQTTSVRTRVGELDPIDPSAAAKVAKEAILRIRRSPAYRPVSVGSDLGGDRIRSIWLGSPHALDLARWQARHLPFREAVFKPSYPIASIAEQGDRLE
jgi:hypothetical protein